jgi:hypothetical protein
LWGWVRRLRPPLPFLQVTARPVRYGEEFTVATLESLLNRAGNITSPATDTWSGIMAAVDASLDFLSETASLRLSGDGPDLRANVLSVPSQPAHCAMARSDHPTVQPEPFRVVTLADGRMLHVNQAVGSKFIVGSHIRYGNETGSGQTASTQDDSVPYVSGSLARGQSEIHAIQRRGTQEIS